MATGVPHNSRLRQSERVCISYKGKADPHTILNGERVPFEKIHSGISGKRLYFGENLLVLRSLLSDLDIAGKVTLVYIDPPFSTQGTFLSRRQQKAYEDNLSGSRYVEHLRARLILLRELLSDNGSMYLHLDENAVFEMKLIMDEIFGFSNYRNLIVRKKCNPKNYTRKAYGNVADFILFYSKTDNYVWNRPVEPLSEENKKEYHYTESETGRRYMKVPVHAPGTRNGATGGPWRDMLPPPGKHWQYTPKMLDEMDARGEIFWSGNGNPRRKVYLDEHPGVGLQDIWLDLRDAHNQNVKITGYPTEKNPDLLRRIIGASSNPGDLVLDCFAGSGTTLAVADEMQRQWIGMDNSQESISTVLRRFEHGLSPMGDYVRKRQGDRDGIHQQPTLFDALDGIAPLHTSIGNKEHRPIKDFSIFLAKGTPSEVYSLVTTWKQRNGLVITTRKGEKPSVASESTNFADIGYRLYARDKKLAKIIDFVGPCALVNGHAGFDFLIDAIIRQQLSKRAAATIMRRFRRLFPSGRATANTFMVLSREKVIEAGVSKRKYDSIRDLAGKIQNKQVRLSHLGGEDDATVRQVLKRVKGIGDWTVDMYLLFGLARLDIFPVNDLALRKIMGKVYGLDRDDFEEARQVAEKWKPYRSVASWYLYKFGG